MNNIMNFTESTSEIKKTNDSDTFRRRLTPLHIFALANYNTGLIHNSHITNKEIYCDIKIVFYDEDTSKFYFIDEFRSYDDQLKFIKKQVKLHRVPLGLSIYWSENASENATIFSPFGQIENTADDSLIDEWLKSEDYWTPPDFGPEK